MSPENLPVRGLTTSDGIGRTLPLSDKSAREKSPGRQPRGRPAPKPPVPGDKPPTEQPLAEGEYGAVDEEPPEHHELDHLAG